VVGWLGHLSLAVDEGLNATHGVGASGRVSPIGDLSPSVWVVPTDEELVMARVAVALLG
jgi:acetate kinase